MVVMEKCIKTKGGIMFRTIANLIINSGAGLIQRSAMVYCASS